MVLLQTGTGSQERDASDNTRIFSLMPLPLLLLFTRLRVLLEMCRQRSSLLGKHWQFAHLLMHPEKNILLNVLISHRWQWHSQKKPEQFGCTSIRSFKFYCSSSRNSSVRAVQAQGRLHLKKKAENCSGEKPVSPITCLRQVQAHAGALSIFNHRNWISTIWTR